MHWSMAGWNGCTCGDSSRRQGQGHGPASGEVLCAMMTGGLPCPQAAQTPVLVRRLLLQCVHPSWDACCEVLKSV